MRCAVVMVFAEYSANATLLLNEGWKSKNKPYSFHQLRVHCQLFAAGSEEITIIHLSSLEIYFYEIRVICVSHSNFQNQL